MSRFFADLRSKLASAFAISTETAPMPEETKGVTLVAYLPEESAAIETVYEAGSVHKISAATAVRIEPAENVQSGGSLPWRLDMTFYLAESELAALHARVSTIAEALGGRLGNSDAELISAARKAA